MVRSVVLLSVIAVYASLLTVDAQKPSSPSSESLSNLLNYLKEHPLSENNGAVKSAATGNVNHRLRNEKVNQAVADQLDPAKKEEEVSEAEKNDPEMSKSVTESGVPPPPANEQEQVEKEAMDTNDKAVPADTTTPAAVDAASSPSTASADASPASNIEETSKEEKQEPVIEESDIAIAAPMKLDGINKADIIKEADAKNEVTRESINDPTKDALRETLRESLRQSVRESMKNNKSGESSKADILSSLRAANQILAQSNNDAAPAAASNPPKDSGVALAGEAASSNPADQNNHSTESTNDNLLPSGDSTVPQIAEPTNIPITNYDMSVTAGMIFTNGGSSMSAASASMSAPYSSGTAAFSSSSSSSSTLSSNQSSKTSSSTGRPSATSTNAAHSGGNTNNYSLMFIGFTIFMSNMITIGFLW